MKIEVIRPFCIAGVRQEIGQVMDVTEGLANELIHARKALGVPVAAETEPAPARRRRAKSDDE